MIINARTHFMKNAGVVLLRRHTRGEKRVRTADWLEGRLSVWQRDHVTRRGAVIGYVRCQLKRVEKHLWTPLHEKLENSNDCHAEKLTALPRYRTPRYVNRF